MLWEVHFWNELIERPNRPASRRPARTRSRAYSLAPLLMYLLTRAFLWRFVQRPRSQSGSVLAAMVYVDGIRGIRFRHAPKRAWRRA